MSLATLEVRRSGDVPVAHIVGEIDAWNAQEIGSALRAAVVHGAAGLVVDLSEVTYLNSAMIKVLYDLSELLRTRERQELRLVTGELAPMRKILLLVGLDSVVPLHASVDEAVSQLRRREQDPSP